MMYIRLRQLCDAIRNIIVKYTAMEFPPFDKDKGCHLNGFKPFFSQFSNFHWKSLKKRDICDASEKEVIAFNDAVKAYFKDRKTEIKKNMVSSGVWRDEWKTIITDDMINWLMDVANPVRRTADLIAHDSTIADVLKAVDTYMQSLFTSNRLTTEEVMHSRLYNMRRVYEHAVEMNSKKK